VNIRINPHRPMTNPVPPSPRAVGSGVEKRAGVEKRNRAPHRRPTPYSLLPTPCIHNPQSGLTREAGLTLVELIICVAIVAVLASAALPIARFQVKREKERELRRDLWEMRDAIDRYKDLADRNLIRVEVGSEGYPPDLDTLVKGVTLGGGTADRKIRFLRAIPMDPMTKTRDWGLRAVQDDPDSTSWGGRNVFDVYSKSTATASDGTKYSDW
jgi:general secretion pathway protein G